MSSPSCLLSLLASSLFSPPPHSLSLVQSQKAPTISLRAWIRISGVVSMQAILTIKYHDSHGCSSQWNQNETL